MLFSYIREEKHFFPYFPIIILASRSPFVRTLCMKKLCESLGVFCFFLSLFKFEIITFLEKKKFFLIFWPVWKNSVVNLN